MFPLSDSIHSHRFPITNLMLILLTIYIFFRQLFAPDPDALLQSYALIPSHVSFSNYLTLVPFVTAIFLHGGFMHIIYNLWFLWVFGDDVEASLRPLKYLFLYFTAGIVGNLVQYLLMPTSSIPMLGASGAIAGVLGYYFISFPTARIKTLVFLFFFVTITELPATIMLGYWFVLQIFSGVGSIQSATASGGVAFWAHIGGFITGIIFAKLYKPYLAGNVIEGEMVS